jgi:Tfp pilus assembly protein PilN
VINLLPPDVKESITFARRNTHLLHWSIGLGSSLLVVIAIVLGGYLYLNQVIQTNNQQLSDLQAQLKVQKVDETQKQVEDISSSLKLVVQVLSKQVLFSKLLEQIGSVMPQNTVLTNLSINKLQGGIDIQAQAADYQSATQVQVNLSDKSNKIFSSADLINIQQNSSSGGTPTKYPYSVTVRAQFSQNNPFLLINNKGSGN